MGQHKQNVGGLSLEQRQKRFLNLYSEHVHNFQRAIILSRRKRLQMLQKRQSNLRQFCLLTFMELESRILEMVPLIITSDMLDNDDDEVKSEEMQIIPPPVKLPNNAVNKFSYHDNAVQVCSDTKFLRTFRMSKRTFQLLCKQLQEKLTPSGINTPLKHLISLETRCAVGLYAFATGADYRAIASLFRISRTSVCKFIKRFGEAVVEKLGPYLLTTPQNEEEYREIRENFQQMSGLSPLCVGLLGVSEIHISPQLDEVEKYDNGGGATTLVLQALIDDKMLIRKLQMEPKRPTMFSTASNEITKLGVRQIEENRFMPCFVVVPGAYYKLQPWLMHSIELPKTPEEHNFNKAINKLEQLKREAFRHLFARWQILQRKCDLEPATMKIIAKACCILHNLLEQYEENFIESWAETIDLSNVDKLCYGTTQLTTTDPSTTAAPASVEATIIRKFLSQQTHA